MKVMGVPVKIHPLLPFVLLAAVIVGTGAELGIAMVSLCLHELAHVWTALALKVRVREIELMPMGGAARVDDIYQLRPGQVALIALSGPLMNLILMALVISLAWTEYMGPYTVMLWLRVNLAIMLFNLIPALPLDGGRALVAVLGRVMPGQRVTRISVWLGRVLALTLILLSLTMWLMGSALNLNFVFMGVFLLISARRELLLSEGAPVLSLLKRQEELADEGVLPVRWLAARDSTPTVQLLCRMESRSLHRIALYDEHLRCVGVLEERQLLDASMEEGDAGTLSQLMARTKSSRQIVT